MPSLLGEASFRAPLKGDYAPREILMPMISEISYLRYIHIFFQRKSLCRKVRAVRYSVYLDCSYKTIGAS